jgi:hypothetical protein
MAEKWMFGGTHMAWALRYKLMCRAAVMGYNAWVHDADGERQFSFLLSFFISFSSMDQELFLTKDMGKKALLSDLFLRLTLSSPLTTSYLSSPPSHAQARS